VSAWSFLGSVTSALLNFAERQPETMAAAWVGRKPTGRFAVTWPAHSCPRGCPDLCPGTWHGLLPKLSSPTSFCFPRLLLGFLPRDTMLARYMLSSRVRLSVHPSVTNRYCIETTGRIELVSAWRLSSTYPTLCHKEIYEISQNLGTSIWDFVPQTPDLENFATASRSRCQQHSSSSCRRWSLLTTPIWQSTSRGCLPQVDQL